MPGHVEGRTTQHTEDAHDVKSNASENGTEKNRWHEEQPLQVVQSVNVVHVTLRSPCHSSEKKTLTSI